jgi:hypothetical protein
MGFAVLVGNPQNRSVAVVQEPLGVEEALPHAASRPAMAQPKPPGPVRAGQHRKKRDQTLCGRHAGHGKHTARGPARQRVERFSEGIERLAETPSKLRRGRFSSGIYRLPKSQSQLHMGSFGDGYQAVGRQGSGGSSHHRRAA